MSGIAGDKSKTDRIAMAQATNSSMGELADERLMNTTRIRVINFPGAIFRPFNNLFYLVLGWTGKSGI